MYILELESFPVEQERDLLRIERRLADWLAGVTYPIRMIASSRPFVMDAPRAAVDTQIQQLRPWRDLAILLLPPIRALATGQAGHAAQPHLAQQAATLSPALHRLLDELAPAPVELLADEEWCALGGALEQLIWPLPHLHGVQALYADMALNDVRMAVYHLIIFPPPMVQPEAICASLSYATGRAVRVTDRLPSMIDGMLLVDELAGCFVPTRPGGAAYSVLRQYDMAGEIDASILHPLLALPFDVTIAIDIQPVPPVDAQRRAEWIYSAARATLRDGQVLDTRSEQRMMDAEATLRELRYQGMHNIQIAVLVRGATTDALTSHVATVRDRLGSTLRLEAVRGGQRELIKLFSTIPTRAIDAPWSWYTGLSHAAACFCWALSFYRTSRTDGILWGVDTLRNAPIFFDPFTAAEGGDNDQAGHMLVLGKTGSGKTFFLNAVTLRAAILLGYRVIWVEANDNGHRITQAAGAGGRHHRFTLEQTINLLDQVYSEEDGASWVAMQVRHVIDQIALLMGEMGVSVTGNKQLFPRSFTIIEVGFLQRALLLIYEGGLRQASGPPIVHDLIEALEWIAEAEAVLLARELRIMIYGSSTDTRTLTVTGRLFNGPTTVDWSMEADIVCFDLTAIQEGSSHLTTFLYLAAIAAIYRYMRDPKRDWRRKTLLILDEFGLAAQTEAVGHLAANMTKVARKYGVGVVVADQNPLTFLDNTVGTVVMENCRTKIMFALDALPAERMAEALPILNDLHREQIVTAARGHAVAVIDNNVSMLRFAATDYEKAILSGS